MTPEERRRSRLDRVIAEMNRKSEVNNAMLDALKPPDDEDDEPDEGDEPRSEQ